MNSLLNVRILHSFLQVILTPVAVSTQLVHQLLLDRAHNTANLTLRNLANDVVHTFPVLLAIHDLVRLDLLIHHNFVKFVWVFVRKFVR